MFTLFLMTTWKEVQHNIPISNSPKEMLPFCQFISNKASVIVLSQIPKDPGHYLNLLPLATLNLQWQVRLSKVKSSVQSSMKIKTKCQTVMHGR